jgi:hypothetical protein
MAGTSLINVLGKVLRDVSESNDKIVEESVSKGTFVPTVFQSCRLPTISINDYLHRLWVHAGCNDCFFLLSFIYIDRIQRHPLMMIHSLNIHRLAVTSCLVASKWADDRSFNNKYWARVGGLSLKELNSLEAEFLFLIRFDLAVSESVYNQYEREARKKCQWLGGPQSLNDTTATTAITADNAATAITTSPTSGVTGEAGSKSTTTDVTAGAISSTILNAVTNHHTHTHTHTNTNAIANVNTNTSHNKSIATVTQSSQVTASHSSNTVVSHASTEQMTSRHHHQHHRHHQNRLHCGQALSSTEDMQVDDDVDDLNAANVHSAISRTSSSNSMHGSHKSQATATADDLFAIIPLSSSSTSSLSSSLSVDESNRMLISSPPTQPEQSIVIAS